MKWIKNILPEELNFEFTRSSGKGGQHVNRTDTAAILRWNIFKTQSFFLEMKSRLQVKLKERVSKSGDLIIRSEESRDQLQNKKNCLLKLESILERALYVRKPRKKTRHTKASQEKRKKQKKIRSAIKKSRSAKWE